MSERTNIDRLADTVSAHFHRPVPAAPVEALRELVALALQTRGETTLAMFLNQQERAEAAEARADELQLALDLCIQQRESWREELTGRADELQRELDELSKSEHWVPRHRLEQARREADQLRADRHEAWEALEDILVTEVDSFTTASQIARRGLARKRAALAGVQAEEQPESREGMVTVYRADGSYAGCMGVERWERLLRDDANGEWWAR